MPKFKVSITLEIPAESADKAHSNVGDFLSCINIAGKPVEFTISDIQPAWFTPPQEE